MASKSKIFIVMEFVNGGELINKIVSYERYSLSMCNYDRLAIRNVTDDNTPYGFLRPGY